MLRFKKGDLVEVKEPLLERPYDKTVILRGIVMDNTPQDFTFAKVYIYNRGIVEYFYVNNITVASPRS